METLKDKILVIQTAFIGDAILTLPMLQELKRMNPDFLIDVIGIPSTEEIFAASPAVNEVIVLDKRGKHKNIFDLNRFCREIRKKNYSRIYSPHRSFRSSFIVFQSGVRETYGFNVNSLSYGYKYLIEYKEADHEVQRNLSLIGADVTGENWKIRPLVNISKEQQEKVSCFLSDNKLNAFITVAPGSIWQTKIYPSDYYQRIISHFCNKGLKVILAGSEKDADLCNQLAEKRSDVINTAGKFSIIEMIELLKYSKILICNDSAPTHFGQCADIPVLTLYCSTTPSFGFYPYSKKSAYLSYDDLFCKPCGIHGRTECPIKTFECGLNLKPASIIQKIEEMING